MLPPALWAPAPIMSVQSVTISPSGISARASVGWFGAIRELYRNRLLVSDNSNSNFGVCRYGSQTRATLEIIAQGFRPSGPGLIRGPAGHG